ncbi:MAG: YdeI/OmpD-associated family protein [Chthoniobacterales bacterium]|nr:YdeI/OmpD-associated family protein [Chthoniobacterales bacterium]
MKNLKVDFYFAKARKWQKEIKKLRIIVLDCQLTEELKWGKPFYTFQNNNVAVIWSFKEHCALGFCKGALLQDAEGILVKPGENTQAVRRIPFTAVREIAEMEAILKRYLYEAIEIEKAGLEVTYKKTCDFIIPEELKNRFDELPAFKTAFHALTPGRQRGYVLYFSAPKQSRTRESRVEKYLPLILEGKGLNDDYRSMRK